MIVKGTVRGKLIELDEPLPLAEGTRVEVTVTPETKPRKGSPEAWLQLVGTLSEEEADAMMEFIEKHVRRIDWELFQDQEEQT
ncbi:MAG: hypothetical protein K6U12_04615 [Armatimonadetes bacterium]|nr:hypothetical protein [Armatimonadota bacterium]